MRVLQWSRALGLSIVGEGGKQREVYLFRVLLGGVYYGTVRFCDCLALHVGG